MGRTLARALPMVVAFTWMVIFSTCANATTYDIFSFDLKTLIGNNVIGTARSTSPTQALYLYPHQRLIDHYHERPRYLLIPGCFCHF